MDKSLADMLRMTTANMTELLNRLADHVETLEYKVAQLEKQLEDKEQKNA
jgi:chaperonin cofactor prefoldin